MNKEIMIKQLSEQILFFKQFMNLNKNQQLDAIKQLEQKLNNLKKQKD